MSATHTKSNRNTKIKKLPIFKDDQDLLKFLEQSLTDSLKQFIRHTISVFVKAEMEATREGIKLADSFNGYYNRRLVSPFGSIEDIPIPRFREGFKDNRPLALKKFDDEKARTWALLNDMHSMGISQRKVKLLADKHLGLKISPKKLKEVSSTLVMHESAQINTKQLRDEYKYLFLDGIWEKVKGYGLDDTNAVVLCVLGVKDNGDREIVGFTLARSEDSDSWLTLLRDLQRRGIKGKNLELIVMDDSRGCKAAVDKVFGSVPLQNCIVHKLRQVLTKTHHKHKASMAEDLKLISNVNSVEEATRVAQDIAKKWYKKEERAITSLRHNFEYCLTYFQFPQDTWKQIRSTNLLEREFREVRRRTKVNDHSFNSFESQRRYHEDIFQYLNRYYPSR